MAVTLTVTLAQRGSPFDRRRGQSRQQLVATR